MKKTLAILLSCMLIVGVVFAMALTSSAENAVAASVKIAHTTGETTLDAATTSLDLTTGTATFDAATGTLTLNGATGIYKISWVDGTLTVKVVGENTITNAEANYAIWGNGVDGNLVITGTGTLNLTAKAYVLGSQTGDLTIDGPKVNVTSTAGTAIHTAANGLDSVVTIKGDSVLTVNAAGIGIDAKGIAPAVYVQDNAKVEVTATGTGINVQANTTVNETITKGSATFHMSGKSQVIIHKGNQATQTVGINNTNHISTVIIEDEASYKSVSSGQGIVCNGNYTGSDKAVLQILDKATVDIDVTANAGNYGQALDVRSGGNGSDVDITTTGTVNLKTTATGWNGAFWLRGQAAPHDVLIKDAKITIENIQKDHSEVVVAFYVQNKANITVEGAAEITAKATANSTVKTNRSHGIYLASGSTMTVKDDVKITAHVDGTAAASWATGSGALYLNNSTLNIQNNASVTATAGGKLTSAFVSQKGTLNASGNAQVKLESTSAHAILRADVTTINVTEGAVITAKGATAVASVTDADVVNAAVKGALADKEAILASKTIAAPTNLKAADPAENKVALTWDAVVGAASYKVFSGNDLVATVDTNAASVTVAPGTAYSFTVKAINAADVESAASAAVALTTPKEGAAAAVTVIPADGSEVVLNAENAAILNGAVSFDVAMGELTLNNATGIKKITWTDGSLTLKVVGTNTVTSDDLSNSIWGYGKDATLTVTGDGTLNVTGKAYVLGSQTGDLVIDGPTVNATATNGTGIHVAADGLDSAIIVKGTSKLNVTSKGYGIDAAGIAPSIIIQDSATVKVNAQNVGMAVRPNKVATDTVANNATLRILDKANVEITSVGSGIVMNGKVADNVWTTTETTITTEGKVVINSTLSGWSAAGIFFTGSVADKPHNFTVKNGTLEVTVKQNDSSEVCCAIYAQSKTIMVIEDATVNATVDCSSTVKGNRGQAIYLAAGTEATVKGDSVVNTLNKGTSAAMTWQPASSSLHVHSSTLTIEGKAVVNAKSDAPTGKVTALALQDGKVIVKGNGKLSCDANGQSAIFNWDNKTNSLEILESGYVSLKSTASAIRTIPTFTINKEAVQEGKFADKEMTITGASYTETPETPENPEVPGTSDVNITAAVALCSIAALAGLAVVILRKKAHN
ncbi:MAG: fibronectin type III domain-containing protein [Clostridia bacterium]|nr:fibronectin type III domain-containing protein [Clostridia bacterium]